MSRILLWLVLGALVATAASQSPSDKGRRPSDAERPNILFLFADDQRADTVGAWGNPHIRTPTIDELVRRGFSFREAHCMGSPHGAVCVPSRAMVHSGRAYHGLDLGNFDGAPTLGQLLGDAGYSTFGTGKWHNGRKACLRSFQSARAVMLGGMSNHRLVPIHDIRNGQFVDKRIGARHSSELFADALIEFLTGYTDDAPFFAYAAFTAPHDPRDPPHADREFYAQNPPPLPPNFLPAHPFDNGALILRDENLAPWPRPKDVVAEQLAEYYGLITHLDRQVARILEVLTRTGKADNTIVVYAADHGLAMGSHGLLGKQSLYEHSMAAPLVIVGPGIPAGSSDALVYLHDLFPTLLHQAQAASPDTTHGTDLSPLWSTPDAGVANWRKTLFTSYARQQRAVRDERWKLIRYPQVDVTQLFDLQEDPHELKNLAAAVEQAERVVAMRTELERWQTELGDDVTWTAEKVRSAAIDLTGTPREPDRWQPAWIRKKYFESDRE